MTKDAFKAFGKSNWSRKDRKRVGGAARASLKRDLPVAEDPPDGDEPVPEFVSPDCPACFGPGTPLGNLGSKAYFRCRNCGSDFTA